MPWGALKKHPVYSPADKPELICLTCHYPYSKPSGMKARVKDYGSLCFSCHKRQIVRPYSDRNPLAENRENYPLHYG